MKIVSINAIVNFDTQRTFVILIKLLAIHMFVLLVRRISFHLDINVPKVNHNDFSSLALCYRQLVVLIKIHH